MSENMDLSVRQDFSKQKKNLLAISCVKQYSKHHNDCLITLFSASKPYFDRLSPFYQGLAHLHTTKCT